MVEDTSSPVSDTPVVARAIGFEGFVIEPERGRLLGRDGGEVALRPKAFELIVALARAEGRPLAKAELLNRVWGRVNVTEDSLFQAVRDVRRALDDTQGKLLRHIPKRGYLLDCVLSTESDAARPGPDDPRPDERPSLAVLPFRLLGAGRRSYLAEGLVEEISIALSRFRWLTVIAHGSAQASDDRGTYGRENSEDDESAVGGRLGARYLVEGSFAEEEDCLVVRCRLLDAKSNRQVWQQAFRSEATGIQMLYEAVTGAIAAAIEPRLLRAEIDRVLRKGTADLHAFDFYLRALPGYYARTPAGKWCGHVAS